MLFWKKSAFFCLQKFFKIFKLFSKKVLTNQILCDRIVEQSSESADSKQQNTIWRSRLVGRGRTIGNRVTGKTVREFESLLLRQKSHLRKQMAFFNEIRLRRVKYGSAMWNSSAVKYLLRKCEEANFISHCDEGSNISQFPQGNYFTFAARRIFHLKNTRFYAIISEKGDNYGRKQIINADSFLEICRRLLFDKLEFIRLYQKTLCYY